MAATTAFVRGPSSLHAAHPSTSYDVPSPRLARHADGFLQHSSSRAAAHSLRQGTKAHVLMSRLRIVEVQPAPKPLPQAPAPPKPTCDKATCSQACTNVPTPTDPHKQASALCRVLGIPEQHLISMVQRCPSIFSFSPEALEASVQAIAHITGLQACQVPQLLAADPTLLLQPDRLKRNQAELSLALGVSPQEVTSLACREPLVLAMSGNQVEQKLVALSAMLSSSPAATLYAILTHPSLLVEELAQLDEQLIGMQVFMCAGPELLTPVVLAKPSLLSTPPQLLADRLQHLSDISGLGRHEVLRHAAKCPDVLAAGSCFVERRVRELAAALHCRESDCAQMLVLHPHLMAQPTGVLISRWQLFGAMCGAHLGWTVRLKTTTPNERGVLLSASYLVLARVRYLADHNLQEGSDLVEVVSMSDALFHQQYPEFRAWMCS